MQPILQQQLPQHRYGWQCLMILVIDVADAVYAVAVLTRIMLVRAVCVWMVLVAFMMRISFHSDSCHGILQSPWVG